jgi:hypothetical protein
MFMHIITCASCRGLCLGLDEERGLVKGLYTLDNCGTRGMNKYNSCTHNCTALVLKCQAILVLVTVLKQEPLCYDRRWLISRAAVRPTMFDAMLRPQVRESPHCTAQTVPGWWAGGGGYMAVIAVGLPN